MVSTEGENIAAARGQIPEVTAAWGIGGQPLTTEAVKDSQPDERRVRPVRGLALPGLVVAHQ